MTAKTTQADFWSQFSRLHQAFSRMGTELGS